MINAIAHPVEIYSTRTKSSLFLRKEWRWRITANNGKIIAASSEGYRNRKDLSINMASTLGSLGEFLTEEQGGVNYSHAKVTLNTK
jgi:hypothetical protein